MERRIEQHYIENYDKLYKMASYRTDFTAEDAEDVVHDAYERALRYSDSYARSKAKDLDTWMITILHNCWKDHYRKYVKERKESEDSTDIVEEEVIPDKRSGILEEYLKELKPLEVRVFMLRRVSGYSSKLTAKVLGIHIYDVVNTLHKIKKGMTRRCKDLEGGD